MHSSLPAAKPATPYFASAHDPLRKLPKAALDDPERLARLGRLGGVGFALRSEPD
ncbi:hypothetical protein IIA16_00525 [bacterium]|nr:hypothetical protein [bacterium]